MPRPHGRLALPVLALGIVVAATLFPAQGGDPGVPSLCVVCADRAIADIIVNVILFLPLGAGLAVQGWPLRRCLLLAVAVSAGIEYAQLFVPHRDSSLVDIVSNGTGAALGMALVHRAAIWLASPPRRATLLALGAAGAAATTFVVSGLLLSPSFPIVPYFGQWTPNVDGLEWYRGRVLDATLGDLPLPPGALANSGQVHDQLLADTSWTLRVLAAAGPPTTGLAPLLRITDERGHEILLLGPDRGDLVFRFRTRAVNWRLDEPDLRLAGAMQRVSRGDTLEATVRGRGGRYYLTLNKTETCDLGFSVANAWALLYNPEVMPNWAKVLLSLVWMSGVLFPAGFWARSHRVFLIAASMAAVGLIAAPLVSPVLPSSAAEWGAGALGFVLGAFARRVLVPRATE